MILLFSLFYSSTAIYVSVCVGTSMHALARHGRARTLTGMRAHADARARSQAGMRTHACALTGTHACTHARRRARKCAHAHARRACRYQGDNRKMKSEVNYAPQFLVCMRARARVHA